MRSFLPVYFLFFLLTSSNVMQKKASGAFQREVYQNTISMQDDSIRQEDTSRIEIPPLDSTILQQLKLDPHSFISYAQKGHFYFRNGQLDSSEFFYKIALAINDTIAEIYNMLGQIELLRGKHKIIPYQKLLSLFKRDHGSKAVKYFKRALEIHPDYPDARYHLGLTYLKKGGDKDLKKAESEFLKIIYKVPNYKDAAYRLGRVYQEQKDFDRAIDIFRKLITSKRDLNRALIRLSEIFLELDVQEAACRAYFNGVEELTDEEMLDTMYRDLEVLLTDEEKKEFQLTKNEKKGFLFKKFWKSRDPTPETVVNERLIEHFRRVQFAKANFPYTAPPYYDDRGKIYIKYGSPKERFVSSMGLVMAKNNESWSYANIHEDLVFDFVEDGGIFRQVQDLREAALAGTGYYGALSVASRLYAERTHLSRTYASFGTGVNEAKLNDFQIRRTEALAEVPSEVYLYDYKSLPLPIVFKFSQFKGRNDSTEIDFYFSLPANLLKYNKAPDSTKWISYLEYILVINDFRYNDILKQVCSAKLLKSVSEKEQFGDFILQQELMLHPGDYHLTLQVHNEASNRKGLYRIELPIKSFDNTRLCMSDLKLASKLQPETEDSLEINARQRVKMIPHPFKSVIRNKPIYLYYEIYNLKFNEEGRANYRIEYRVKTIKEKLSFWGKTFGTIANIFGSKKTKSLTLSYDRNSDKRDIHEYLAFDFSNLVRGETEMEVMLRDLNSNETASSYIQFSLIDE